MTCELWCIMSLSFTLFHSLAAGGTKATKNVAMHQQRWGSRGLLVGGNTDVSDACFKILHFLRETLNGNITVFVHKKTPQGTFKVQVTSKPTTQPTQPLHFDEDQLLASLAHHTTLCHNIFGSEIISVKVCILMPYCTTYSLTIGN